LIFEVEIQPLTTRWTFDILSSVSVELFDSILEKEIGSLGLIVNFFEDFVKFFLTECIIIFLGVSHLKNNPMQTLLSDAYRLHSGVKLFERKKLVIAIRIPLIKCCLGFLFLGLKCSLRRLILKKKSNFGENSERLFFLLALVPLEFER